jgi:exodeoxyribonuclease VII small subunit
MAKSTKLDFESICAQLNATIGILEDEQVSLQDSLKAFELGITLARQAQQTLAEAEQKVQLLLEGDGQPVLKDFEEQE